MKIICDKLKGTSVRIISSAGRKIGRMQKKTDLLNTFDLYNNTIKG